MSKQPPPAPTASAVGPCPTLIQISRTPRHWKFTQHHRTTRPSPQSGLSDVDKDLFFDQLRAVTTRIPGSELLIPCGNWNGHFGGAGTEYREVHDGMGYGRSEPDVEGERILEYAQAFERSTLALASGMIHNYYSKCV